MSSTDMSTREVDIKQVMGETLPDVDDPEIAQRAIAERILQADDLAGLFIDLKTTACKDMVGVPIEIRQCRVMRSNIDGARGTYMLLEAVNLTTGELCTLNTGAPQIMAVCMRATGQKYLPLQVEVIEAATPQPGKSAPLGLKPIGATLELVEEARKK